MPSPRGEGEHAARVPHGLLDHAEHLLRTGCAEAAAAATGEAHSIAERLGCQPLLVRAATTEPATPRTAAL